MSKELKISAKNALAAYNNTDAKGKELLEHLFGKEIFAPKDIKTLADAMEALGQGNTLVEEYIAVRDKLHTDTGDLITYLKLRIIVAALNEGWEPQFTTDEYRYYPWFYLYTKEEYDKLDDETKGRCVLRSGSVTNASCGFVRCCAYYDASGSSAADGSRLAFKTRELAEYCGKQFIEIWEQWLFA